MAQRASLRDRTPLAIEKRRSNRTVYVLRREALGAYFGAYLKKKAEFLALREDFAAIKEQLAATTAVAESVTIDYGLVATTGSGRDLWRTHTVRGSVFGEEVK